jgi:hypothetical protein
MFGLGTSVTLHDLARELRRHRVETLYCLTGGLPNEAYTIEHADDVWRIYYSERGCRTGLREFATESEACMEFLRELTKGNAR